tara:strand:- start:2513 stop:2944 length:432 start_codon:yes stop_codon:yes gene_type:complete
MFVATILPRAIRGTEINGNTGIQGKLGMLRHLASPVIRHVLPCSQWHSVPRSAKAFHGSGSIVHLRQNQITSFLLDYGVESRWFPLAFDQVAFRVPGELTFLRLGRTEVDADHVRDLVTPINFPSAPLVSRFSMLQAVGQFFS